MSRISRLLEEILSAVYGRDVRQAIHDAIEECYRDVSTAKTIADDSAASAIAAASSSESRTTAAISTMQTQTNLAVGNCNSATTAANSAAVSANTAANNAQTALEELDLRVVDGRLCVKVERS